MIAMKGSYLMLDYKANKWKTIGMICAGSGIAPMIQVCEVLIKICEVLVRYNIIVLMLSVFQLD